ncbi:hypothetical protein LINGRAHAP2_LOCUS18833 [Linum grandiflorum]
MRQICPWCQLPGSETRSLLSV